MKLGGIVQSFLNEEINNNGSKTTPKYNDIREYIENRKIQILEILFNLKEGENADLIKRIVASSENEFYTNLNQ